MIQKYITDLSPPLIEFADTKNLQPASYNLRLGDPYYQNGHYGRLAEGNPFIAIKPHGMVVVSSKEKLHLPRYLIGRWNLRVKLVYNGLLWAGGPQVDPGFAGHLFCPLYNLSSREVIIKRGEHIFTIDFEKTTKYDENESKRNPNLRFPESKCNRNLEDYVPSYVLKSSVEDLRNQVERIELLTTQKVNDLQSTVLIGLSIVFAGLTIVATLPSLAGGHLTLTFDLVTAFYLILSIASLIISIFAFNRTRKPWRGDENEDQNRYLNG